MPQDVHLIAVEKKEPYRCGVWKISNNVLCAAQLANEKAMRRLTECERTDIWPTGYEDIRLIDLM